MEASVGGFLSRKLSLEQNAVDLRVEMHYSKKRKHNMILKRFENANKRAKSLVKLLANSDVKAIVVLTSVMPTAILELAYAGEHMFLEIVLPYRDVLYS